MSYDLYLVRIPQGADPIAYIQHVQEQEEAEGQVNPGDPIPEKEAGKQAIARELIAVDSSLTIFPFDYAEIARFTETSESEARLRYRHLELNGPENGPGIQITLYDDTASVTLPYWHGAEAARQAWRKLWSYLHVLEREGGFNTYDPQLEQILDLSAGVERVLDLYGYGVECTQETAAGYASGRVVHSRAHTVKKPWWRFWER